MALKIDDNLLVELGLGSLPAEEKRGLLSHIYETLEMRVGMRLADQMTNEQLDEFERYFEAKDDAGAFKWLESNFPNYKDIVNQEFEKLKLEVGQSAQHILNAGGQPQQSDQPQPQGQLSVHHEDRPQQQAAPAAEQLAANPFAQPQAQPYYPEPQPAQPIQQPQTAPQPYYPQSPAQQPFQSPDQQPQYQPQPAQPQVQPFKSEPAQQPYSPQSAQPHYPQQPVNPATDNDPQSPVQGGNDFGYQNSSGQPPAGFPPQQ